MKIDPIITGGIIGFVMGAFGFIIGRFWIIPISRYTKIKNEIRDILQSYADSPSEKPQEKDSRPESLRKLSVGLSDAYALDIPLWYRMVLDNRKESPNDAAAHLMTLANTKNKDHIRERIQKIRASLRLEKV